MRATLSDDLENPVLQSAGRDYARMSVLELKQERKRLLDELLTDNALEDAFERAAILEQLMADSSNPLAVQLLHLEEARQRLSALSSTMHVEHDKELAPLVGW